MNTIITIKNNTKNSTLLNNVPIEEIHLFNYRARKFMYDVIANKLNQRENICPRELVDSIFENTLGTEFIGEGASGKIYNAIPLNYDFEIVIKEVVLRYMEQFHDLGIYPELESWEILTKIVIETGFPHFPLLMATTSCNTIIEGNKSSSDPILNFITEKYDGSIDKLISGRNTVDSEVLENFLLQALITLACGQHLLGLHHGDIKAENFLYKKIKPGGYWEYNIRGNTYYVENFGYLLVLSDFDSANFVRTKFAFKNSKGYREFGDRSVIIEDDTAKIIEFQNEHSPEDFDEFKTKIEDNMLGNHVVNEKEDLYAKIDMDLEDLDKFPPTGFAADNINVLRMFVGGEQYMGMETHSRTKINTREEIIKLLPPKNLDSILNVPGYGKIFSANEILKTLFERNKYYEPPLNEEPLASYVIY